MDFFQSVIALALILLGFYCIVKAITFLFRRPR